MQASRHIAQTGSLTKLLAKPYPTPCTHYPSMMIFVYLRLTSASADVHDISYHVYQTIFRPLSTNRRQLPLRHNQYDSAARRGQTQHAVSTRPSVAVAASEADATREADDTRERGKRDLVIELDNSAATRSYRQIRAGQRQIRRYVFKIYATETF